MRTAFRPRNVPDPSPRQRVRKSGTWQHEDYHVFDAERDVGRIYLVHSDDGTETWFWGVSFQLKAGFRAEYEAWKGTQI
jgi:hypothetical protein